MGNDKQDINDFKGYHDVTAGSLIHILRRHGVDTRSIFTFTEKHELQPDISLQIKGKIFDNKDVFSKLVDILFDPTNQGKRLLLVSDTGTGKSYALTRIIHKLNEKINTPKTSFKPHSQFAVYSCPRRALINNLKGDFESDGNSTKLTGSDAYMSIERDIIINQSSSFITTVDHAPRIIESKLREKERAMNKGADLPCLLVTDEIHVLGSTDASFKLDAVRNYFIAEREILDMNGVSLHVTATPENLYLSEYDLIIQINQEYHENPFKKAGYFVLGGSKRELKSQFLRMIRFTAESNRERKLLIFIEDTEWIEYFCEQLQERNIKAIGIVAKKDNQREEDEITIIDQGVVSGDIQVILATTVLSSGVSIIDNKEMDETWVLCSSNSLNHELTRLTQMSHRFRNKYNAFKIFFQKAEAPKEKKAFLYHKLLEEKIKKAANSKELVMKIRRNPTDYLMTLDNMEQQSGLFSDKSGKLHVLTPMIQSKLIHNKTYYNYKNQDVLIRELEQRFQCDFINFDLEIDNVGEKEEVNPKQVHLSNKSSKEILKELIEDENVYSQLKREYVRYGRSRKKGLMSNIKRHAKEDLIYFIDRGIDYDIVKKVMNCHLHTKKEVTCSYLQNKEASKEVEKLKRTKDPSIQVKMYEQVRNQLKLAEREGIGLKFNTKTEVDNYLDKLLEMLSKNHGYELSSTNLKGKDFRGLLNYEYKPSNGKRKYTIIGFIDERCLKERFGLDRII